MLEPTVLVLVAEPGELLRPNFFILLGVPIKVTAGRLLSLSDMLAVNVCDKEDGVVSILSEVFVRGKSDGYLVEIDYRVCLNASEPDSVGVNGNVFRPFVVLLSRLLNMNCNHVYCWFRDVLIGHRGRLCLM